MLVISGSRSVHEGEFSILDTDCVCLVEESLIWRALHSFRNLILFELVTVVSSYDTVLNDQGVIHVIDEVSEFSLLVICLHLGLIVK